MEFTQRGRVSNRVKRGRSMANAASALTLAVGLSLMATSANGATQTWDPGLTTTGSDGLGTWDTTTTNWASGGGDAAYINDGTTTPTFGSGGTVGIVTINAANVNAAGINFNLGYTIATTATDTLTLTAPTITVAAGQSATINAPITGTAGLTVLGNLTLGSGSTFTGNVSVPAGSLLTVKGSNLGTATGTPATSVGPNSAVGLTTPGSGNVNVANGGTLSLSGTANNVINFGSKVISIAGMGTAGTGAIINPSATIREFDAFNFLTLTGDALISGSRMDIGRDGDGVHPDVLDLGGHTLTINMNGAAQPMFGIQAAGNGKSNTVGTTVTAGQMDILKGSLDIELNANLSNDGTITFESNPAFGTTSANVEFFKTDGVSCTRPMVFKGNNIIGPGAANAGSTVGSNMTITGAIGFEGDVSGNPGNNTANCTLTLSGNIVESGTASINLLGSCTTVLTGTNVWSGGTNFGFNGTLTLGSAGAFPTGTPVNFGNASGLGGTFDLGGFNATVSAITATSSGDTTSTIGNSSTTTASTLVYAGNVANPSTFRGIIKDSVATNINVAGIATARTGTQTMGVSVTSGSLTLSGVNSYSGGTSVSNGTLIAASNTALGTGSLAIHAGGVVQLQAALGTAVVLTGLTVDGGGTFDLANNKVVVNAASKASALPALQAAAHSGIMSTGLPANYGIAVIDNGALATPFTTFGGVSVDTTSSILIAPEMLGDVNADGKVDGTDLAAVLGNFGAATGAWNAGNFDGAGTIDLTDLADVLNNFGKTGSLVPSQDGARAALAEVPEPASLAIFGLGAAALIARRRLGGRFRGFAE